jgi:hypothetical protein
MSITNFKPAPKPVARLDAGAAAELKQQTADLGFSRTSGPPEGPSVQEPERAPVQEDKRTEGKADRRTFAPAATPAMRTVKFDVEEDLWTELRVTAARRKTTIKYLFLEMMAQGGYPVDLATVPEDGRRAR